MDIFTAVILSLKRLISLVDRSYVKLKFIIHLLP